MLVEVHGRDVRTGLDFHRILAGQMDFGPYYGRNLDALWDRLSVDIERPIHLVWYDADVSRRQLGPKLFDAICRLLDDVVAQDRDFGKVERFTYELR